MVEIFSGTGEAETLVGVVDIFNREQSCTLVLVPQRVNADMLLQFLQLHTALLDIAEKFMILSIGNDIIGCWFIGSNY